MYSQQCAFQMQYNDKIFNLVNFIGQNFSLSPKKGNIY